MDRDEKVIETLETYNLATDVKSIWERIEKDPYWGIAQTYAQKKQYRLFWEYH